ncbi:hypothetical protein [Streptomyces cylindrosporus]|uniref:Uncharacterized protein n=1 Tax=Streptomyces cylindrosporus TaxID=2927583 RepID=A0ABS9YPB6_9ACTN|nr:hypothetical protein [Streptomyces cylindrosporus]MCI3279110.1 hypothetical protein [Streptomyces cylindrosporus]
MSDTTSSGDGTNVINFPRLGFTLTPTAVPQPSATPVVPSVPNTPPYAPSVGRRSPLDLLAALPDPSVLTPALPPTAPAVPGTVPDTFRSEPASDLVGPRLGALSLAAILAVAVAAVRGTHTYLTDRRTRRLADQTETDALRQARAKQQLAELEAHGKHQQAMQGIADKAAQQRAKNKVPSSQEFGRKSLAGRSGAAGGGSGSGGRGSGGGAGRSAGGGKKPGSGSGSSSSRTNGPGAKGRGNGAGAGAGGKKSPLGGGRKDGGKNTGLKQPGAGDGRKGKKGPSPTGGKSPSTSASSPAMERARRRQDRADKRQAARLERRAKDQDAARDRKNTAKQARQAVRDKVRDDRIQAKEACREKARDAKFEAKQKQREAAADAQQQKKADAAQEKADRTGLPDAVAKEARRRLKKRRKNLDPPVLSKQQKKGGAAGPAAAGASTPKVSLKKKRKVNLRKPKGAGATPGAGAANQKQKSQSRWARARAYARKKTTRSTGPTAGPAGNDPHTGQPGPQAGQNGGTRQRRTPFQNAAQAAGNAAGSTHTVTSDHVPGSRAKRWEPDAIGRPAPALPATGPSALDAAPTINPPRPGTTRPKEPIPMPPASAPVPAGKPDPRITKAKKQAARAATRTVGRRMDAQHATEITLDDACDGADKLMGDGFKTHDQAAKLAGHARSLRDAWIVLAEDCATNSNLTGALYTTASIKFAESMELVARMADEMRASSLEAAEQSETAGNELNDAYRPITQATADAGLTTPSAPVHNEV